MKRAPSILDQALAAADRGLRVHPLNPLSKTPILRDWPNHATCDPNLILEWFRDTPNANYGIATGDDLFVMDLDGEYAIDWWKTRGFEPGSPVTTPSGGEHFYYFSEGVEIQTNQGKIFKYEVKPAVYGPREISPGKFEILEPAVYHQIDVRGEGGYVVGPGSMLPNGTYKGTLEGIPMASEDLIAILPERQHYTYEQREVAEPVLEPSETEQRQVASAINNLQELPEVWAPGSGWHDTVYRTSCWLSRMVNANDYAMTEDGALAILMGNTPTYPGWGQDKILEQWVSARKSTVGQVADPVQEAPPVLPFLEVSSLLPETTSRGRAWTDLLFGEPAADTAGAAWEYRRQILVEAMRAGLNDQQAVSVVWSTKAAASVRDESNGFSKLWREAQKARLEMEQEAAAGITPPSAEERTHLLHDSPMRSTLLTDAERTQLADQFGEWWGTEYLDWAASRVTKMNAPYHRLNRWAILAIVFGMSAFVPLKAGALGLNLFLMIVGQSSTGKSEGKKLMKSVLRACFPSGDSPDIGGDATANALVGKLIERDGKPSLFNADEAHGLFAEMASAQWRGALQEKWTDLYEGEVPSILRAGNKDQSGIHATTSFTMHLMGTRRLMDVLDSDMWESGFLARYVFAIGEDRDPNEGYQDVELAQGTIAEAYDMWPKQWAAKFADAKRSLDRIGIAPLAMKFAPDALARHNEAMHAVDAILREFPQREQAEPIGNRFGNQIFKCASLVALSEGTNQVTLRHVLIAVEQAEEWLGNALFMLKATTDSLFTKRVNEVELYVSSRPQGQSRIEEVYRRFRQFGTKQDVDRLIDQLIAEGRVGKDMVKGGGFVIGLKGAQAA